MVRTTLPLVSPGNLADISCESTIRSARSTGVGDGVDIPLGTVIGGAYRIVGPLGSGAMGAVLLAHDETLDRLVAIKFVHAALLEDRLRERFRAEARAMARVSHPNVLQIFSFGEHEGAPYFVMEYVDGSSLERWLAARGGPPPFDVTLEILEGICEGVSAIHAAQTVHRDIKPSNILLGGDLRPRVADLGLAIFNLGDGVRHAELVGTPAYMAPEIAFAADPAPALRERADVYSLACVAYELFTGQPPFVAETNMALLLQHATEPVVPPHVRRPDLPIELSDAILRGLAKDPAQRTSSAEAFRRECISGCRGIREPVRILVAEDNDDFREALRIILASEFSGAEIECVADGQSALEAFDRKWPSAAIIDLRMPGLDGAQLTLALRERDPQATIPIIVLTASGGADEWKLLAQLGADRLLVKPVMLDDVVMLVRRSLNERPRGASI